MTKFITRSWLGVLSFLFSIVVLGASPTTNTVLNEEALLDAIRDVETGGNDHARGSHGERSAYQMKRDTWRLACRAGDLSHSFSLASNPVAAREVARAHLKRVMMVLAEQRKTVSVKSIALAWTCGEYATNPSAKKRDYAQRVENLYRDNLRQEEAVRKTCEVKIREGMALVVGFEPHIVVSVY